MELFVDKNFGKFAQFTLTDADAKAYVASISPTKRVKRWQDIQIRLYI